MSKLNNPRKLATLVALTITLSACAGMSNREKNTALGATAGGAAGAVLGGGAVGILGGAAVGGVLGHELGKDEKRRH
jgi:osmotically inducible lipoprotein OsmB